MGLTEPNTPVGTSLLPIVRVHRIIKADQDVRLCSKEAIFLIGKAAEFMIGKITLQAHAEARIAKRSKMVKYQDLATVTGRGNQWFYLSEVIPPTIPLAQALAKRSEGDGADLDPTDENHPSHPSTTGFSGVAPVKKGRKKPAAAPPSKDKDAPAPAPAAAGSVQQWAAKTASEIAGPPDAPVPAPAPAAAVAAGGEESAASEGQAMEVDA
ncbi:hypothetical protein RQP46_004033 [Phenoliferia psychrophenolica]